MYCFQQIFRQVSSAPHFAAETTVFWIECTVTVTSQLEDLSTGQITLQWQIKVKCNAASSVGASVTPVFIQTSNSRSRTRMRGLLASALLLLS